MEYKNSGQQLVKILTKNHTRNKETENKISLYN